MRDEHRALAFLLMCPAWDAIYKARIAEKAKEMNAILLDPRAEVRNAYPDDYIRGFISALKWAIEWPDQEMNAAALLAQEEANDAAEESRHSGPLFGGSPPEREVLNGDGRHSG